MVKRIGAVLAVLGGLFGVLLYIVSSEIRKGLEPYGNRLTSIETRFDGIEKRLDRIDTKALPAILSTPLPTEPKKLVESLQERTAFLMTASERHLSTSADPVIKSGLQILKIAEDPAFSEEAWQAYIEHLNYKSFLNSEAPYPDISQAQVDPHWKHLTVSEIRPQGPFPEVRIWGRVPISEFAFVGKIGEEPNPGTKAGPSGAVLIGGYATLNWDALQEHCGYGCPSYV